MASKEESAKTVVERYALTLDEFHEVERSVHLAEHLKRYGAVRRFCYGKVLDFACGCGYGSYMLALNPDVESVTGVDVSEEAVEWARTHFAHQKATYEVADGTKVAGAFDTLVCLETLEHIKDRAVVPDIAKRTGVSNIIVSFPDKKTTHYNPHHLHDFMLQEVIDLFPGFALYHQQRSADSTVAFFTKLPAKAPHDLFRNLPDLG